MTSSEILQKLKLLRPNDCFNAFLKEKPGELVGLAIDQYSKIRKVIGENDNGLIFTESAIEPEEIAWIGEKIHIES